SLSLEVRDVPEVFHQRERPAPHAHERVRDLRRDPRKQCGRARELLEEIHDSTLTPEPRSVRATPWRARRSRRLARRRGQARPRLKTKRSLPTIATTASRRGPIRWACSPTTVHSWMSPEESGRATRIWFVGV